MDHNGHIGQYRKDSIVISKGGKPLAALVDAGLFARIRRVRERFDALSGRVAEAYADVSVDEGLAEIDAAVGAKAMKFPDFSDTPEELLEIDGHCGLLAAWSVLSYFGKQISAARIVASCRYTKRHGVFAVCLTTCLKEHGLRVSFHSDPDDNIGGFEMRGYARGRRLGLIAELAIELPDLLRERKRGRVPIVLFNTDSDIAHFSPLLGIRRNVIELPLAENGSMPVEEFLARWSAPEILRQCVIAGA
jgi:hypothetical protein